MVNEWLDRQMYSMDKWMNTEMYTQMFYYSTHHFFSRMGHPDIL